MRCLFVVLLTLGCTVDPVLALTLQEGSAAYRIMADKLRNDSLGLFESTLPVRDNVQGVHVNMSVGLAHFLDLDEHKQVRIQQSHEG